MYCIFYIGLWRVGPRELRAPHHAAHTGQNQTGGPGERLVRVEPGLQAVESRAAGDQAAAELAQDAHRRHGPDADALAGDVQGDARVAAKASRAPGPDTHRSRRARQSRPPARGLQAVHGRAARHQEARGQPVGAEHGQVRVAQHEGRLPAAARLHETRSKKVKPLSFNRRFREPCLTLSYRVARDYRRWRHP